MTEAVVRGASSDYELLARLAQGGMAEIFLARVRGIVGFERYVVLKRIRSERDDDPLWVQMFLDEARLVAQLTHPNIAQVFDLGEIGDSYFYTMEYVHGEDVLDMLTRTNANGERIPLAVALGIAVGAAQGLAYAHERRGADGAPLGIVHRDVSPANLMVSFEGVVKVLDFGVAKARSRSTETEAGTIMGKIAYLSPEQCNTVTVDHRSDQFSLGIVLYETLTHHRPFKRPTDYDTLAAIVRFDPPPPSSLNRDLPPGLDAVVLRALAKNPRDRFESAHALIEALEQVADNAGIALAQRDLKKFMRNLYGTPPEPWRTLAVGEDSMGMFQGEVIGPMGPETELRFFPPDANANDVPLLSQSLTPLGTPSYVHPPSREPAESAHYRPVPRLPTDDLVEAGPTPSWSIPPVARHAVGTEPSGSVLVPAPPVAPRPMIVTPTAGVRVVGAPRRSYRVVAITAGLVIGIGVLVLMVAGGSRPSDAPGPAPTSPVVAPAPTAPANPGITATPIEEPAPSMENGAKPAASVAAPASGSITTPAPGGIATSASGSVATSAATTSAPAAPNGATSAQTAEKAAASPSAPASAQAVTARTANGAPPPSQTEAKPGASSSAASSSPAVAKPGASSSAASSSPAVTKPGASSSAGSSSPAVAKPGASSSAASSSQTVGKASPSSATTTSSTSPAAPAGTTAKPADPKKGKAGTKAKPACTDPLDCQF